MAARMDGTSAVELMQRTDETIDRLAKLMASAHARSAGLTKEQKARSADTGYLDQLVGSGEPPEEYLGDAVEIRRIGHVLNEEGGEVWMMTVALRAIESKHISLGQISKRWDGIGDWRG